MSSDKKISLIRKLLHTLGLSEEAIEDIFQRISYLISKKDTNTANRIEYPYKVRDDFLSSAELSFYLVLKNAVSDWAVVYPKIGLRELFYVNSKNFGFFRSYTNKIDRKHVDFLLCDPVTIQPIMGIELDDKSHMRSDRRKRDRFVENVFKAAKLPLTRIPAKYSYSLSELSTLLMNDSGRGNSIVTIKETQGEYQAPKLCPKCGSEMVLRTVQNGSSKGKKFWGCTNFPKCRGILNYDSENVE